jgi:hypothetical protein
VSLYLAANWYAEDAGAIYVGRWSFHWEVTRYKRYEPGVGFIPYEGRPRRRVTVYRGLHHVLTVPLWRLASYCEHGMKNDRAKYPAWWHDCALVSESNPKGRIPEEILWPEDAA